MGWRGALRSINAASRAAERDRQRRANAARRLHNSVDRVVQSLDSEVERDLARIEAAEERIRAKPLSGSGVSFDPQTQRWIFKEISDRTGQIKWNLRAEFTSDTVQGESAAQDAGRTYELIGLCATRWAVFAAFRIIANANPGRPTKLFNKTNPANNKVVLLVNGVAFRAVEGQLDIDTPSAGDTVALAAFPLPSGPAGDVSIEFLFKSNAQRIRLNCQNVAMFTEASNGPSLLDQFRSKLTAHTTPMKEQATATKAEIDRKLISRGSAGVLLIVIVIVLVIVAIANS